MKRNDLVLVLFVFAFWSFLPEKAHGGVRKGAGGGEDESLNSELGSEGLGPSAEHVGDDEAWRGRVGAEPVRERLVEVGEREHDGANGEGHVFGVFDAGRERRVRGEGED